MRYLVAVVVVLLLVATGALVWALRYPEIAPITPPTAESFAPELVAAGELFVGIGDCAVCHTQEGGADLAGGLPLPTPFGVIHSTNITPDVETGIGAWSLDAFRRAMHEGVDRRGQYLYPAFPYDHFTKVTDADIEAIYAFLMTQEPAANKAPENELGFPFNQRILMAGWNLLFLDNARFTPDASKSESWNRGAYLAEGLGHCGACHSPRNMFGAVEEGQHFAGAEVEGWQAPALNNASPAPAPWTEDTLVNYFLDGWDGDHGIAAGPMAPVVDELGLMSEDDAYALAEYVISFQDQTDVDARIDAAVAAADEREYGGSVTPATGPEPSSDPVLASGQAIFSRVCANCHRSGTEQAALGLSSVVNGVSSNSLVHIIENGIQPPEASFDRSMPAFGAALSDADMAALVAFVREHFSDDRPAWTDIDAKIAAVRAAH